MANYFRGSTEKNAVGYKCGEKIVFNLELTHDGKPMSCPLFKWEMRSDDRKFSRGMASGETGRITLSTSLEKPGFVHLIVTACSIDGKPLPGIDKFEGGAGADILEIRQGEPDPEDFDEFWAAQLKRLDKVEPAVLEKKEVPSGDPNYAAYDIKLASVGEMPVSGLLTMPRDAKPGSLRAKLAFQGYSITTASISRVPDTICFHVNIHGCENLREPEYYENLKNTKLAGFGFNREENKDPSTCYFLGVILRDIQAARFLKSLPEYDKKGIKIEGGSMGAMQAVSVAAHFDDAAALEISVPWLCDLGGINAGRLRGWRPEFDKGVRYFDTVSQAKRVKCPVNITCGLGDYVCPPSTESVLYQSFNTQKSITFVQNMTHPYRPVEKIAYTI
jgi:cephalosporin-C deacetylase